MAHLQMEVPEEVRAMIAEAVESGEFATDADVVSAAIRRLSAERDLQHMLDDAGTDPVDVDPAEVLARLKAEFAEPAHH